MSTVKQTIRELHIQRNRAHQELEKMSLAIKALESLGGRVTATRDTKPKRKISAAGRARIAAAQKARWAKIKAQKK